MNTTKVFTRLVVGILFLFGSCYSQSERIDRQPAVAGSFYPAQQDELNSTLKQLFAKAVPSKSIKPVIAIISPHAGYVSSGEVAASSFHQIDPEKNTKTFLLSVQVIMLHLTEHRSTHKAILLRPLGQ